MTALPPLPPSNLLIAGRTIPIMPRLVQLVGLNEAIVLQQVRYLLDDDRRPLVRDGRRWVAASYAEWQERHFPFWHVDTVERAFRSLERRGIIQAAALNASRRDHTKWYTVDFARLLEWEQVCRASLAASPLPRDPYRPARGGQPGEAGPDALPPLPPTDLLLDEHPLLLLPRLAALIGFDEAIALQQVRYWLADSRNPLVREGRRWVRFNQEQWHAQLSFRSKATVARTFRRLEEAGLLLASSRFNPEPGDRTKAYTIDFDRLAALHGDARDAGTPSPRGAADTGDEPRAPGVSTGDEENPPAPVSTARAIPLLSRTAPEPRAHGPISQNAANQDSNLRRPMRQSAALDDDNLRRPGSHPAVPDDRTVRHSLGDQTDPEITIQTETEQQPRTTPATDQTQPVVVPQDLAAVALVRELCARGLTRASAIRLSRSIDGAIIGRQLDIFDWLRGHYPDDRRITPGRLRRMIEEDWSAPEGYLPADERARRAEAAERQERERAGAATRAARQEAFIRAERQALLDAIGLAGADQATWARITQATPPLPTPFRDALFHAPQEGEAAAVIFRDRGALARATGPAHAETRARIAARVSALCGRPGAPVHYLAYDDLLRLLHGESADAAAQGAAD